MIYSTTSFTCKKPKLKIFKNSNSIKHQSKKLLFFIPALVPPFAALGIGIVSDHRSRVRPLLIICVLSLYVASPLRGLRGLRTKIQTNNRFTDSVLIGENDSALRYATPYFNLTSWKEYLTHTHTPKLWILSHIW